MRFVLHYRGALRANGGPAHKHDIRKIFHAQLKTLWAHKPLAGHEKLLHPPSKPGEYSLVRAVAPFTFVPLVSAELDIVADLRINILRPEAPGNLLTQGGDIDNRLKTLFDALSMPRHTNQLPSGTLPGADEEPFFCLLEDDNLVTSVAVRTEQLLEPGADKSDVDLTVDVEARPLRRTYGNGMFG